MKISLVQMDIVHGDKNQNIKHLKYLLKHANQLGDIVLLPELFSTGYIFANPSTIHNFSEVIEISPTVTALKAIASELKIILVFGLAEKDESKYYNSIIVLDRTGVKCTYRKISQTNIDRQYFSRGTDIAVFEHLGVKFGLAICFDIWFPEIIGI